MIDLNLLSPHSVFTYFSEISKIPRGSGNMSGIADYCVNFAKQHSLKYVRDSADNVVIYKQASPGYEDSEPIILQGHLDIVCQKTDDCDTDFSNEGLRLYTDGDFIKAEGTTLGADNGIAVAMILAILDSDCVKHPKLEAVFTTDEEIGMLGAFKLDTNILSGRRMINLDSEQDDTLTVSCAGGSDFKVAIPFERCQSQGVCVTLTLKGLKGGHSGVDINLGRVNANMLAGRVLNHLKKHCKFEIISIDGGDKANAIPTHCVIKFCVADSRTFISDVEGYLGTVKAEISEREPEFEFSVDEGESGQHKVICENARDNLIFSLVCAPNGVVEMSAEIDGLVETSLNLGILSTISDKVLIHFALRSNKNSSLAFLEEKLKALFSVVSCKYEASGHYPPWEFNGKSQLQKLYKDSFYKQFGKMPKVEAIHAGLECGVFSAKIDGLDCIAIGPTIYDVHTVNERLSISSTQLVYNLLIDMLEQSK